MFLCCLNKTIIEGLGGKLCQVENLLEIFFSSKVPEFSHVAFKLMEKHCSVFFFVGLCFVFEKKRMQKTKFFLVVCL